eukprot:6191867-Pleurochrysis_carterae.AAC.1
MRAFLRRERLGYWNQRGVVCVSAYRSICTARNETKDVGRRGPRCWAHKEAVRVDWLRRGRGCILWTGRCDIAARTPRAATQYAGVKGHYRSAGRLWRKTESEDHQKLLGNYLQGPMLRRRGCMHRRDEFSPAR